MKSIEEVLDFQIIRNDICRHAYFEVTKRKISEFKYSSDIDFINNELSLLDDAFYIVKEYANPILDEVSDIDELLNLIAKDYVLNKDEFYEIYKLINASVNVNTFLRRNHIEGDSKVLDLMKQVNKLVSLNTSFKKVFDDTFSVKDDASIGLMKIKESISNEYQLLKKKLNEIISKHKDIIVGALTIKNDRYVLPVNFANKYTIDGIIVEQSSSLKTSYVEPTEAIEINNRISRLKEKEQEEIYKIFKRLSADTKESLEKLVNNYELLKKIDFVFAKAIYCYQNNCCRPTIGNDRVMTFKQLYHPFIPADKVVKNDLNFDKDKNLLLISGPNAGGKTVLLKSIVLASYMAQLGLYVFASDAKVMVFDNYFVDLGDNQSIINSLSTFSSHITNLKEITDRVTDKSLVVLDELGSSTDPKDGEALAIAIANYLINKNSKCIITTHFTNLKNFAFNNTKCKIISMTFDTDKIIPTYKIVEDVAGSSFAYEIASIVGLRKEIIDEAKNYRNQSKNELETSLEDINKLKLELHNEKEKMLQNSHELELLKQKEEELNSTLIDAINENKKKANEIIEGYISESKEILNELLDQLHSKPKENELIKAKGDLDALLLKHDIKQNNYVYNVGEKVYLPSIGRTGIITNIKGNEHTIEADNLRMIVGKEKLEPYTDQKIKKSPIKERKMQFNNAKVELNIIGKHADEAKEEILKFISDALVSSLREVRIIHGYGEGVLRKVTHEVLKNHKSVASYHYAGPGGGGMGATIVELKV